MSTTFDESTLPTVSDEDFEAHLAPGIAALDDRSEAELIDGAIANHLLEAGLDKPAHILSEAETNFTKINEIKVTIKGHVKPIAVGKTLSTYKCFALSRGLVG